MVLLDPMHDLVKILHVGAYTRMSTCTYMHAHHNIIIIMITEIEKHNNNYYECVL